ncbi:hypothetical protein HWB76_gp025 [Streptomyces phage Blueeyedbeauty]|uniref:Uncharacterized protein n=1 Tax=Streptomyces phage Blueeyedbeauty TaxID=2250336 RepID=A0A345L273_9CAUD|nr:hypothetical protein HWB76_gp025 [Streptomyces phage Blueeyedbeauty]AXH49375.1 hypothetical protein SEA_BLUEEYEDBEAUTY_268 [Streptomyces phage Blueeyedbeauty]
MRTATVNGRPGIIVAQNGGKDVPATRVFVLFDGDDSAESSAGWFDVHSVLPTGIVAVTF